MNFFFGFIIVFSVGISLILSLSTVLKDYGYTETQLIIVRFFLVLTLTSVVQLLTFFGRNEYGETLLERIGKPITSFILLLRRSLSSRSTLITLLLIIIINILIWK